MKIFCVYILSNKPRGTLYIGVTSNLKKRIFEHKEKLVDGFTKKYDTDKLVWYEVHREAAAALNREKQIKKWDRAWKIEMVENFNPTWEDLYESL